MVVKILLFLTAAVSLSSAATHSMQYILTAVTPGLNLPEHTEVGMVDGEEFVYYDSNIGKVNPRTAWIKKVDGDDADYWNRETKRNQATQEAFKAGVQILMQRFNQTKGVHTWQLMYGCELDDDESKRGYVQYGYDGEDFVSLDLNTLTWIAPTPQAVVTKNKWEADVAYTNNWKNVYLLNVCTEWIKKYVGYGRDTLERKVPPEVSVFQKDSSSPVVCHATGFFPKAVMISWQKNGEELNEDVELRETVPNQDGSFQKRSILTLSPEELKNSDKYTCVVHHSSLEKEKVLKVSDRVLHSGGGSDGGSVGIIIGVVVAVLLLAVIAGVGFFIWKRNERKNRGDALETSSARTSDSAEAEQLNPPVQKNP